MNQNEFKKEIRKGEKFDTYSNYFFAALLIVAIVYFAIKGITSSGTLSNESLAILIIVSLFSISICASMFWLIPNKYKIHGFDHNSALEKKKQIIADTAEEFKNHFYESPDLFWHFSYQKNWWNFRYNIFFAIDHDKIFFAVVGSSGSGIMDFGQTQRLRNKIKRSVLNKLS